MASVARLGRRQRLGRFLGIKSNFNSVSSWLMYVRLFELPINMALHAVHESSPLNLFIKLFNEINF